MIGVIGPADSVAIALDVALSEGRAGEVIVRAYQRPEEARSIALELAGVCKALLFTGRVPYALSIADGPLGVEARFISHSGADLYRAIAEVLIERQGQMPAVSVDAIDEITVKGAFRDINLPEPTAIMPIWDEDGTLLFRDPDEIAQFHLAAYERGEIEGCLTCLAGTYETLREAGVPVWRIEHTRGTIREALNNALMAADLRRSNASQIAVAMFSIDDDYMRSLDGYERDLVRLRVHQFLIEQAKKFSGRPMTLTDTTFAVTTSRGAIEKAIERYRAGQVSFIEPTDLNVPITIGVGIGETYALAEDNAEKALELSTARARTSVVFPDGSVHTVGEDDRPSRFRLQETTAGVLELSQTLGVGTLSVHRLMDALERVDSSAVSPQQLAEAYGLQQRSARRLLTALVSVDLAEVVGRRAGPGKGRPQTVYSVDMAKLATIMSSPPAASHQSS